MKILYVAQYLDRPEMQIIRAMIDAGDDVQVLLEADHPSFQQARDLELPCSEIVLPGRIHRPAIKQIKQVAESWQPDIVHCLRSNRPLSNTIRAIKRMKCKLVAYRGTMGNLNRFNPGDQMTYLNNRIDRLVCVSDAVYGYLVTLGIPRHRLITIHKGHDPSWYKPLPRSALEQAAVPKGAFTIGCAAAIRPLKGVDLLIQATQHIDPATPVHLVLAGTVKDQSFHTELAKVQAPHQVHLLGHREDAPGLMGACDLFVMASREREGLPRAVIEAMAQGVPPIVTRIGGMPELVEDGVSGFVVDPESSKAIAEAVNQCIRDPKKREALGAAARERIEGPFNVRETIGRTREMYAELVGV